MITNCFKILRPAREKDGIWKILRKLLVKGCADTERRLILAKKNLQTPAVLVVILLASLKAVAFGASHLAVLSHGGLRSNFACRLCASTTRSALVIYILWNKIFNILHQQYISPTKEGLRFADLLCF